MDGRPRAVEEAVSDGANGEDHGHRVASEDRIIPA
jgi:hypothetical protein